MSTKSEGFKKDIIKGVFIFQRFCFFIFLVSFLGACQQAVRVSDVSNSRFHFLRQKLDEPLLITEKTVVLDSRPKFDYMMYSVPGAIHLLWQQLLQNPNYGNSVVVGDKAFSAARRLARLGVSPESEVIVLGKDQAGQADAGRLAWSLLTLGFKNVQVTALKNVSKSVSPFQQRTHKSIPIWKPNESYFFELNKTQFSKKISFVNQNLVVLDVRSQKEYLHVTTTDFKQKNPNFDSKWVPWTEFYTGRGRPEKRVVQKLFDRGVSFDTEIIVVSNKGVRSGAVSFALLTLGFKNVRNFSAGFSALEGSNSF